MILYPYLASSYLLDPMVRSRVGRYFLVEPRPSPGEIKSTLPPNDPSRIEFQVMRIFGLSNGRIYMSYLHQLSAWCVDTRHVTKHCVKQTYTFWVLTVCLFFVLLPLRIFVPYVEISFIRYQYLLIFNFKY